MSPLSSDEQPRNRVRGAQSSEVGQQVRFVVKRSQTRSQCNESFAVKRDRTFIAKLTGYKKVEEK